MVFLLAGTSSMVFLTELSLQDLLLVLTTHTLTRTDSTFRGQPEFESLVHGENIKKIK